MLSFSYRVGLYGFLASERVRQDGDLNVGMLDQRMALTWVKNHITQVRCTAGSPLAHLGRRDLRASCSPLTFASLPV